MPGPSLRLIQDTLVNADGSRASGTIQILWSPGVSTDGFAIAGGSSVVRFNKGNFATFLAPGTYQVRYVFSSGSQHSESWLVPTSAGPFRIQQVRQ